ncbi:MAG: hypothetical protein WA688_04270, partial [Thermoplasmata archaeon]
FAPMTAISAPSASNAANPPSAEPLAHVRIPGSPRTYEVRDVLRGMGLRWDPLSHAWHGMLPGDQGSRLARDFGLKPQLVPTIEAFGSVTGPEPSSASPERPEAPRSPALASRPRNGSRTRTGARVAFPGAADDPDEVEVGDRRLSVWETTSGLPDDSREVEEQAEYRHLVDLRSRVKIARAVASKMPGLAAILRARPDRAARFYARFGITDRQFSEGVRADLLDHAIDALSDQDLHGPSAQGNGFAKGFARSW